MKRLALVASGLGVLLALLALLVLPATARATVMLALDLPHLVGRSDAIFVGKVVETRSRWTEDGRRIVTDATLEVRQRIRGAAAGKRVVVRSLGGTVDGIGMRVAGAVALAKDEEVLLFTERRGGHRFVVGMRQGMFRLARDARGQARLQRSLQGLELIDPAKQQAPAAKLSTASLSRFVEQIQQTISLCRRKPASCRHQLQLQPSSVAR